ncbi:MAG: inositol monophosphatase family protein [Candidatus Planktophila sp.]|nr:inositol monophosphatase family protein [Candidatus Planktophila sp.]
MKSHSERYAEDLALAHLLADIADSIAIERYQALDLVITTKPDNTPVTDADRAVETAVRQALSTHRPDDGLLGEEFGSDITGAKRYWIIDPIDGTKNFMRGVPIWACLIALVEVQDDGSEEAVVGVASSPALSRRWFASKGQGAFVTFNGDSKKISVSQVSSLSDASIAYSDFIHFGDRLEAFQTMLSQAWRTRGIGDFWSHMLVAEGAVDVAIEPTLAVWDMAALDIIVREAGGTFTNITGKSGPFGGSGVSTNGILHNAVINGINPSK